MLPPLSVSLTQAHKSDCRTLAKGQSILSRGSISSRSLAYLVVEGVVVALHLLARWVHLFKREPLRHHPLQVETVKGPVARILGQLDGAFKADNYRDCWIYPLQRTLYIRGVCPAALTSALLPLPSSLLLLSSCAREGKKSRKREKE